MALAFPLGLLLAGVSALPGFPARIEGTPSGPPIAVELGGRQLSLLVVAGGKLWAFHADGSAARGFPAQLPRGTTAVGAVSAASGYLAVALEEGAAGRVALFGHDGRARGSIALPSAPGAGVSLIDLDGDGTITAVVGDRAGALHALGLDGKERAGFPALLGAGDGCSSTPAFGRLGGSAALVVGTAAGKLHAVTLAGKPLAGFPARAAFAIGGWPALADLDGDGAPDLLFGSEDFHVYALRADGKPLAGFPVEAGYRVYGSVALADLQGDGKLAIAAAAGDGKVYAWDSQGRPVSGYPVAIGARVLGGVVAADVDRDGKDELVAVSLDGQLAVLRTGGEPVDGFPVALGADAPFAPLVADLLHDGRAAIAVATTDGKLHAFRVPSAGTSRAAFTWPSPAAGGARAAALAGGSPLRGLVLNPSIPRAADALAASWEAGGGDSPVQLQWLRDGVRVAELDGKREVPKGVLRRGQKWRLVAQSAGARQALGPEVTIANSPPTAPVVELQPPAPRSDEALKLQIVRPAVDPDGDEVRYRVRWLRDGAEQAELADQRELPRGKLKKGAVWTALVVAHDGADDGPLALAEARVENAPPGPLQIALPAAPRADQPLRVQVVEPPRDPDGDALRLLAAWTIDGKPAPVAAGALELPPHLAKKGQLVAVRVRATDGELFGPEAAAQARIADSPPTAPSIALEPAHPRRGDELRWVMKAASRDADGDAIDYRVRWLLDGAENKPPGELRKGQSWAVEVTPVAAEALGQAGRAEAVVDDSPPSPPRIALLPAAPLAGAPLEVQIAEPALDADGDAIALEAAWTIDGKPAPELAGKLSLPAGTANKHQRLRVEVAAVAAGVRSQPAAAEVQLANSPPGKAQIALDPGRPTQATGLSLRVVEPAHDDDGDRVEYRVAWRRDGLLVPGLATLSVPPARVKHGELWRVEVTPFDGEVTGPPSFAEARIADQPPTAPAVALTSAPTVLTGLRCEVKAPPVDPDGDALTLRFRWWRDGESVPLALEAAEVPGGLLRKGQRWRCEAAASDGTLEGPPGRAEAVVGNAPPAGFALAIEPPAPRTGDELFCGVAGPLGDPDGDPLSLELRWLVDGKPAPAAAAGGRAPSALVRRGQRWTCQGRATDGEAWTAGQGAEVIVQNSAPGAARVRLEPAAPHDGTPLRCTVVEPAADRDGDAVGYRTSWFRDGQPLLADQPGAELPGRLVLSGARYQCSAVPTDGLANGPPARSLEVRVLPPASAAR